VAIDIVSGVNYLHSRNIIHSDLKSPNILLDEKYRAKITDFGVSKIKETMKSTVAGPGNAGTVRWQAPELWEKDAKTEKSSDIYSLGTVLWEIYSHEIPFKDYKIDYQLMMARSRGEKLTITQNTPNMMSKQISACWEITPNSRPTTQKILVDLCEEFLFLFK